LAKKCFKSQEHKNGHFIRIEKARRKMGKVKDHHLLLDRASIIFLHCAERTGKIIFFVWTSQLWEKN
jgi:hypothetical protein